MNPYPFPPDMPPALPAPRRPHRFPRWLAIVGLALAFTLALGVGVVIGSGVLPTFANADLGASPRHGAFNPGGFGGVGLDAAAMHGAGRGLTVTSVGATSISATRTDRTGATTNVTINTTSSTQYFELGQSIDRGAIKAGMKIAVRGTRNSDGSITATRVDIILPGYHGTVTGVSGGDITIKDQKDNTTHVIHTDASTTFTRAGQSSSLSAVATSDQISAAGILNGDGSLTAKAVRILLPHAGGKITAINGSTVTVQNRRGTQTIHLSDSTTYTSVTKGSNGPARSSATKSDLAVGKYIIAQGTKNSDGSLNAVAVDILPAPHAGMWHR